MSDTDDTDVLVLIPHDFFTVSSSEDEHPLTERNLSAQKQPHAPAMSQDQDRTPTKPASLHGFTSPYKHGDNFPKRTPDHSSSFRSPSKPEKSFHYSPSKGYYYKPNYGTSDPQDYQTSPRYGNGTQTDNARGAIPKSGILTTYDSASPSSRFRRSTSDLPNLLENQDNKNQAINNQRQRSYTGEFNSPKLSESKTNETTQQNNGENKKEETPRFRNPEQPEVDPNAPPQPPEKVQERPKEHDNKPQPYVGENAQLPFVCGDNIGSIPDLGFGLREFLASLKPSVPQSSRSPTPKDPVNEPPCTKRYFSPLGGEAAANLSGSRRQLNFDSGDAPASHGPQGDARSAEKPNFNVKRPSAFVAVGPGGEGGSRIVGETNSLPADVARSPSVNLPSLGKLWLEERTEAPPNQHYMVSPALLQQRLEEEKYRRLHCEQLISDLQQKLLRESERVAVATQVDARKDEYLSKLRERYEGTARHWHEERERMLQDIAEKSEMCSATIQRLRGCERELSKALDLASGFQQRSLSLEREKTEGEASMRAHILAVERQCAQLEQETLKFRAAAQISEQHENKRGEQMAALNNLVEDERQAIRDLETENKRLTRELSEKEAAALTLEAERDTQQAKLQDMKQRAEVLEQQKGGLQQALEEIKKKERASRQEVRDLSSAMEQSRHTLKEQYQAQLDHVVRGKLAEFQSQLDSAESAIRQQWEAREAETRTKHARALSENEQRHLAELRQVEERHTRDIAWWQRSLAQAMEQVQELTAELERQEKHREQLAGKIRSMLQAQYQQAANLIWEPPNTNQTVGKPPPDFKGWGSLPSMGRGHAPSQAPPPSSASENQICEPGKPAGNHDQLKRYIEMLLQRPIGDPLLQDQSDSQSNQGMPNSHHQNHHHQAPYIPELDLSKLSLPDNKPKPASKDNQKPPWK